jgi:ssDNA-binding replication factor A large subunit
MYKIPLEEIKNKIVQSGKLSPDDLDTKIKEKINELSGLISEEGAAHIIANELGVELVNAEQSKLKIKEIYAGMRTVTTVGKVIRKFDVREFAKGDKTGKVCSLVLGDETGTVRVVFWNEQVDLLDNVNPDDIVLVNDGYVRENNNDREIHLGKSGEIVVNPGGVVINSVREGPSFERKNINELSSEVESAEILGTIVQVFDPRFFNVCSNCNKRVTENEGKSSCVTHGEVPPSVSYVMNAVIDDGTGTIRTVFWKNQTNHLLGKEEKDMVLYKENPGSFEDIKNELLGEQFKLMGRVKRNDMFDRLEFNAQLVQKADPKEEIARLERS